MKKTWIKSTLCGIGIVLGIILAITLILIILTVVFFLIYDMNSGDIQLVQQETSPNGDYIAYVMYVYGGATTPNTCQVKIAGKYSKYTPLMRGNIYISTVGTKVEWLSDKKLRVFYDDTTDFEGYGYEVFLQENEYKGIEIVYK